MTSYERLKRRKLSQKNSFVFQNRHLRDLFFYEFIDRHTWRIVFVRKGSLYLSTSIIVLILVLNHPVNASEAEDVVYSRIESVAYEKGDFIDNMTNFKFIIKGQIINTLEENVTVYTGWHLYSINILTNLDQETQGGFSPTIIIPAGNYYTIQPGVQNYSTNVTLGIFGNYNVLPDGNYTFNFRINGFKYFNYIPFLLVFQNGTIIHSEHVIIFNTLMPVTSTTNIVTSNSEQIVASSESTLIDPLPISSSYLLFLLLPIFSIFKSRFKVKTRR